MLKCWNFNDKLIAGGRIGVIKGMSPGSATLFPSQTTSQLASPADLFSFFFQPRRYFFLFPPMRILVPGYKLYISKYKLMYAYRLYLCTWGYQYSMFPLHKSLQPRLQVWTQRYKSIELSFRACSYYRF